MTLFWRMNRGCHASLSFAAFIPVDILHFHLPTTRQGSGASVSAALSNSACAAQRVVNTVHYAVWMISECKVNSKLPRCYNNVYVDSTEQFEGSRYHTFFDNNLLCVVVLYKV